MNKETRTLAASLKIEKRNDEGEGVVLRGHAAVFNSDSHDLGGFVERIEPGAFKRSIDSADDVRALFNHDTNIVLGRTTAGTLRLAEDERGLAIEIDVPDTQYVRDLVVAPIERGDISQMSFGFRVRAGGANWTEDDDGQAYRTLTDLELFEVSPVTFPAYPDTDIAARELRSFREERKFDATEVRERMQKEQRRRRMASAINSRA